MSNSNSGWIGVDLDGTLAHYEGWNGVNHIGAPLAPMVERVKKWIAAGKTVEIFTARMHGHGMPIIGGGVEDVKTPIKTWCKEHLGAVLEITNVKDFGMIELWDDRAIQVESNTGHPVVPCKDRKRHIQRTPRKNQPLLIWIRQGDQGEYDSADSIADLGFAERQLGRFKAWQRFGFSTDTYEGHDYISLYWGDKEGEPVRYLTRAEKAEVERLVNEAALPAIYITDAPEEVTLEEFLGLFDEEVHDALRAQLKKPNVRGIVCFENLMVDSSCYGDRTALVYGIGMSNTELSQVLAGKLGDVPSRFQFPVKYYIKPI